MNAVTSAERLERAADTLARIAHAAELGVAFSEAMSLRTALALLEDIKILAQRVADECGVK